MKLRRVFAVVLAAVLLVACAPESKWQPDPKARTAAGSSSTSASTLAGSSGPGPVLPHGTFVARASTPKLNIWWGPKTSAGRRWAFPTRNPVGQPLEFLIKKATRDEHGHGWLKIWVPVRPNGTTGWVRKADVSVEKVHERIIVDLSSRILRHYRDGRLAHRFSVGIGHPQTPTAVGTFFVWAQVPQADPMGPYGNFALGLSGFSPVLKDWPGGGRMAIHGTAAPGDRGQMVSHGCVRVYNSQMADLEHVPMGTPVVIKR